MFTRPQYTVPVGEPANEHETAPRRNAMAAKAPLVRPRGFKCNTAYELALECFQRGKDNKAMGWRDVVEVYEEQKQISKTIDGKKTTVDKTWLYYELSDYRYITFNELTDIMHDLGKGLNKIGLRPNTTDRLHIFASTSQKWMQMYLGTQSQSIPIVTAYDTLGESGLIHSIKQTESTAIFTDNALLPKLINPLKNCPSIKYLIYGEPIDPNDKRQNGKIYQNAKGAIDNIKEIRPDLELYSFDDIMALGKENRALIDIHPPKRDDLSCIMYTSGSTGEPKGVVLKQYNIVAGIGGANLTVSHELHPNDRIISFLPLAHIFELAFELLSFLWGSCIGYATVKTLTNSSVRNCQGDLTTFKPTVMVGVAAVWETVRKGILSQIDDLPFISQKIFWSAYHAKINMKHYRIPGGDAIGNLVFKKIRKATGGNLRFLLNGGSPISTDAQIFISTLVAPMLIGYGLTETVANGTIMNPSHFEFGVAGDLTGCVTVKLVDEAELGYFAKNNQGEVWIKGDNVLTEYYKNKEETEKALTADGWFKTGDIGEWTPKGHLRIIDRKKNLVKTLNGEYVALEKLESVYRSNSYVSNVLVYADPTKVKPVSIVVPNWGTVTKLAKSMGVIDEGEENDIEHKLQENKQLQNAVYTDMLKTAKQQGLNGIELIAGTIFVNEEWTPQNGYVTSAQKLKRNKIVASVKSDIEKVYNQ
ncbi:hypothetical protein KAFR_0D01650 [Kazachstania africana CBS 2517]|uniref:AMP-dependent synthetase/ligase domain-containing protein n=1 Tax=Kazachstania africana (strain ATCC 22294 / BCRC 22015 / CBS 2517 / CECT 1963 / NBRC 1671 / NRRL Y-8276) TaxID=1071382 RepID=H2ATW1_KAZAF|nr:hypothetical protein KAFR_0D01650 [Kazachstania africana CBS 2517]CCF57811.1 hypothetical protein KAFR_0D01650 [Kazachstania africana CBS 2517]